MYNFRARKQSFEKLKSDPIALNTLKVEGNNILAIIILLLQVVHEIQGYKVRTIICGYILLSYYSS